VGDRGGDVAGVERGGPLVSEPLQGVGELGLTQCVPGAQKPSAGGEQRRRLRRRGDDRCEDLNDPCLLATERHAISRQRRRGRGEVRQRDGAELPRGLADAGGQAGRAGRGLPDMKDLERVAEGDLDRDQRRVRCERAGVTAARRLDEEVEQHRLGARHDGEQVSARAQPGEQRLAGQRREHRSERCVDGVSAVAQYIGPGARAHRVAGGDDAARAGQTGQ
jgi:hypothetical protein